MAVTHAAVPQHLYTVTRRAALKLAVLSAICLTAGLAAPEARAQDCNQYYQAYQYYMQVYNQYRNSNLQTYRNAAPQVYAYAQQMLQAYNQCRGNKTTPPPNNNNNNNNSNSNSNIAWRQQLEQTANYYRNKAINDLMRFKAPNGYVLRYYLAPAYQGQSYMGPYTTRVSKWEVTREINRIANNLGVVEVIGGY
jgi:hypothetical protein